MFCYVMLFCGQFHQILDLIPHPERMPNPHFWQANCSDKAVWCRCLHFRFPLAATSTLTSLLSPQYGAEFRRFSVDRAKPGKFEEFYKLILHIHRIANMEVMIGYADIHGDLLPINNDDNFCKAVSTAHPLLRIFIQRQGRPPPPPLCSCLKLRQALCLDNSAAIIML